MKRHISLLVAAVMVLTLIYTPAGLVYGAEEDGSQTDSTAAATLAEENAEEPAAEEQEPAAEEQEPAAEEQEPAADPEENAGTSTEGDSANNELAVEKVTLNAPTANEATFKVTVVERKANSIVLSWNAYENAHYKVVYGETEIDTKTTTATITGLTPNTEYKFTVTAYDQDETPLASADVSTSTTVAAIENLKALHKKATEKSVVLTWSAPEGTDYSKSKVFNGTTQVSATFTESQGTITATVSGLSARKDYSFTVKAYDQDGKVLAEGKVEAYTCPEKTLPTVKVTKSFPNYVVSWTKANDVVGYEFRYSMKKNEGTINKLGESTLKKTITKLKNGKTYYFQVRAKYQYKDGPVVTSGWKTVKVKAATTGWKAVIKKGKKYGKKYYYVNGVIQKNKEFWLGKLKYYVDKNGIWRGGSKYMWNRCKKQTSGTDTMLVTSRNRHTVCIFKKVDGTWCCQYEWLCSVGKKGSRTPHGAFYVRHKKKSFGKGHTCWYATRYHKKYPKAAFHSVLYKKGSKTKIKDGRLGKDVSNGCVRLPLQWAKWIYDNVKKKSRILIY